MSGDTPWTPGPWALEGEDDGLLSIAMSHDKAWMHFNPAVSSFGYDPLDEMRANARLIACAPELAEALRKAKDLLGCLELRSADNCWWVNADDPESAIFSVYSEVTALLAKIGGEA